MKILSDQNSIVSEYLHELRDVALQKDRRHFVQNLETLGMIAGYELSKLLQYKDAETKTPLGSASTPLLADKMVISTVLRAGLPVHRGLSQLFPAAEPAFIAAGRKPENGGEVEIDLSYVAGPSLQDKVLIIADTMLATGKSIVTAYEAMTRKLGQPKQVFVVVVLASKPGVEHVSKHIPNSEIITCALDPELNDRYFIVPGLGDAGDLLYGEKL